MKKLFKKLMAMLLTITLITGMFPAVMASGEGTDEIVDLGRPIISTEDEDSTGESGPQHSDQVLPEDTAESTDETIDLGKPTISTEDKDSTGESGPQHSDQVLPEDTAESTDETIDLGKPIISTEDKESTDESGPQHSDQVLPEDTTESTDSGNACAHENTETAWNTNDPILYSSVSNTQHTVKGYQYRYCTSCFKRVGDSFAVTEKENHTLDKSGNCTFCGYTASCKHTNTKYVIIDGFPAYICHDEKEHIVDTQYKEVCKDCDKVIKNVVDSKRTYVHEAHRFDSNGICSACKYVKPEEQTPLSVSVSAGQYSAKAGTRISATASATGGDGSYSFAWKVMFNGGLLTETGMGYGSSYDYAAKQEGSYAFAVTVRDGSGNTATAQSQITVKHIHEYKTVSSTELINQDTTFHNVVTTTYEECSVCHQKTDPVVETVPEKHAAQRQSYETEHPHKLFFVCKCGAHPYVEGKYKTANGKVQEAAACCICHGHKWGNPVELSNGSYKQICNWCGETQIVYQEKDECDHVEQRVEGEPKYYPYNDIQHMKELPVSYSCSCGKVYHNTIEFGRETHSFVEGTCTLCGYNTHEELELIVLQLEENKKGSDNSSWEYYAESATRLLNGPHFAAATKVFGHNIDVIDKNNTEAMVDTWKFYLGKTLRGYDTCVDECLDSVSLQQIKNGLARISGPTEAASLTLESIKGIFDEYRNAYNRNGSMLKSQAEISKKLGKYADVIDSVGDILDFLDIYFSREEVAKKNKEELDVLYEVAADYVINKGKLKGIMRSTNDPQLIQACNEVISEMKAFYNKDFIETTMIRFDMTSKENKATADAIRSLLIDKIIDGLSAPHAVEHLAGGLINAKISDVQLYKTAAELYKISLLDQSIFDETIEAISRQGTDDYYLTELYTVIQIYGSSLSIQYLEDYNYTTTKATSTGLPIEELEKRKEKLMTSLVDILNSQNKLRNFMN